MPEKNESSPREACGLPKQGNACPYAKLAPDLCARCGCFRKERAATLVTKKDPAKKPKAEPKKKKFGRGPQRAGSGICYNPLCPTRNNYRGAWSCTDCRFCPERKFTRQSRWEVITI